MGQSAMILTLVQLLIAIQCNAWDDGKYSPKKYNDYDDDGKYSPKKYNIYDDGKYYRSLDEGKYIPGDEGKYTYIYRNTLYPAFPYIHEVGPSGTDNDYRGPNGGFGPNGGYEPNGGDGPNGGNGPNGPNGGNGQDESNRIQYIGRRIYAERYPYIHKVIEGLVNKYVSTSLFGDTPEGSSNHYSQVHADKETAVKCHYLSSEDKDKSENNNEFVTQYPPRLELNKAEKLGSYYGFKGSKILSSDDNALERKIKLEYEVFVRVVEINE